ncbi:hypothetical protein B0A53_03061 [Rhodotorula sp. CCFEE 5036]|nr:hypothetical protein B0A53_03061 [Rhodotorula sp. CCFEE 5036]
MSRVTSLHEAGDGATATADESDAAMGFAGEEVGSAASSASSVVDDSMRDDDELAAAAAAGGGEPTRAAESEEMMVVTEADANEQATSGPSFPAAFGSVFPPSPSGPSTGSSRRSGARPYPTRGASSSAAGGGSGGAGGSGGGRSSRRERAGQMFAAGGTEFERERANIEGRRGAGGGGGRTLGDGQEGEGGKSPEEVALAKVVDRGYAGKLNIDPFWSQVCAMRQAKAAAAENDHAATTSDAPGGSATATNGSTSLPPPVPLTGDGSAPMPSAPAA